MIIATKAKLVWNFCVLDLLNVWMDPLARSGPENMAIDEWLWLHMDSPILRVYCWEGDWTSIGYFSQSPQKCSGDWVRRPTGGGIVRHEHDWTYTLMVPRHERLAVMTGAESYRILHQALANVLQAEGHVMHLAEQEATGDATFCFTHPVIHDLVNEAGEKIAGAGQRRGRTGLLHQGSLACQAIDSKARAWALAQRLAHHAVLWEPVLDPAAIEDLCEQKYRNPQWNAKR